MEVTHSSHTSHLTPHTSTGLTHYSNCHTSSPCCCCHAVHLLVDQTTLGVYIKFGQHLAQMAYLVPDAYCDTMQTMLHQAPTSPFSEVQATIHTALGRPIDQVFISLSPVPVASASLAQVHFGVLKSGEEVAVKVQHRFLKHTIASDIRAVKWIVKAVHWLAPAFDYNWQANTRTHPRACSPLNQTAVR